MLNKIFIKNYILIKELEVDFSKGLNIITGETGVNIINKIYPELKLEWSDEMQAKINDGILFCPMQHPSRISYKKIAEDLNYFFDLYFENTRSAK